MAFNFLWERLPFQSHLLLLCLASAQRACSLIVEENAASPPSSENDGLPLIATEMFAIQLTGTATLVEQVKEFTLLI